MCSFAYEYQFVTDFVYLPMFKHIFLIILTGIAFQTVYAHKPDTIHTNQIHYLGLRTEMGWNKSWFTALGISSHFHFSQFSRRGGGIFSMVFYAAAEVNYANYYTGGKAFYGYKAGAEFGVNGGVIGFELKGLTDFTGGQHGYFTPKAGFGLGYGSLMYGYNIFRDYNNTFGVGEHQITLSANLGWKVKERITAVPRKTY